MSDLDELVLNQEDLDDLRRCRPGKCGLKLSDNEISSFRQLSAGPPDDYSRRAQDAFRQIFLARALTYLKQGLTDATYHDKRRPLQLRDVSSRLIDRFGFLNSADARACGHLRDYPSPSGLESFLYWSIERLGARPIAGITHATIVHSSAPQQPQVLLVSRQVYASHYLDGGLAVTALQQVNGMRFLIYLNRSHADLLGGFWGPIVRQVIERRLGDEGPAVLRSLKQRLESGDPPQRRASWPID